MKTIQMTIDERLLKLVDRMSRARKTNRSAFIREALEAEIRRQRIREEEARHAEGYARNPVAPGEFDAWLGDEQYRRSHCATDGAQNEGSGGGRRIRARLRR
jgi:predicted transcriptional regulator